MTSINCSEIKKKSKKISVIKYEDMDVEVKNKSGLEMIGKGRQGAVFKINDQFCMKIYGEIEDCEREYYALSLGKKTQLLPKVHCKGKNFVVMDMVYGVDLREYLQVNPLTKELSYKLIEMLLVFKEIGYERIDHHKRQIYLQHELCGEIGHTPIPVNF
jgi:predicted Ser/Thr protein kinase